ncbi:E3 ubiquitin-protein ligase RNF139-like [Euwallacea similis]|uniref:E3 ubiquitin-protein ligase RNF139-like n=1 Tax=Euwallacea similis TaxID=1736056 RepID=UPI003450F73C
MTSFSNIDSNTSINQGVQWCPILLELISTIRIELMEKIHNIEQFVINLHNIYAFVCQISFFILCEYQLVNRDLSDKRADKYIVVALSTVLFYSVVGYFATRMRDIYQRNPVHRTTTISPSLVNYMKWLCKIVLEWAKAVVVVLCLREHGLQYNPRLAYSLITFIYYLCTERICVEAFSQFVEAMDIEKLENLEHLYVPLFMNLLVIAMGFAMGVYNLYVNYSNFILLSLYFMVYLRIKDVYYNYWQLLLFEREAYSNFHVATRKEIDDWDDICAVCLNRMSNARITPCNHLFHPYCLKQCLRTSLYCPLCKQYLVEVLQRRVK